MPDLFKMPIRTEEAFELKDILQKKKNKTTNLVHFNLLSLSLENLSRGLQTEKYLFFGE